MEAKDFEDYLRFEKRYAEHTVTAYYNDIAQFSGYLNDLGIEHFHLVKSSAIRLWVVHLVESGCNPATIRRKISALNTFYKFQIRKGYCHTNPAKGLSLPKLSQRLPKYIEQDKLADLLSRSDVFSDDFQGLRDRLIIELLYVTGMRRQELVQLKWSDVNSQSAQIKILGKGNKERLVPVSLNIIKLLEEYKSVLYSHFNETSLPDNIVISNNGREAYPELIYQTVKKHLSLCSTQQKKSPHVLRHSFATHLSNNGAPLNDIKELLGHASLASTQVYTHNTIEQLKEVYKIAHPKA